MYLSRLAIENFRNFKTASLDFPSQGAVFFRPNGSGKTNLLESIFLPLAPPVAGQASRDEMIAHASRN